MIKEGPASRWPSGLTSLCGSKGADLQIEKSARLESLWPVRAAWVRIPLPAPINDLDSSIHCDWMRARRNVDGVLVQSDVLMTSRTLQGLHLSPHVTAFPISSAHFSSPNTLRMLDWI